MRVKHGRGTQGGKKVGKSERQELKDMYSILVDCERSDARMEGRVSANASKDCLERCWKQIWENCSNVNMQKTG